MAFLLAEFLGALRERCDLYGLRKTHHERWESESARGNGIYRIYIP